MADTPPFLGTGVALVTPFTAAGTVDTPALVRLVQHVTEGGVEALVPLGTTGESVTLTPSEQHQVLETVFEHTPAGTQVWVGCGGNNTAVVAQALTDLTKKYPQANGFLSVSPAYNKPSQAGIRAHYKALTEATDKPLILYNVPGRTASTLTPDTILRLASDYPNIVGVKDAVGDLLHSMALVQDRPAGFRLYSGEDALAFAQVALGFDGCISVVANAFPAQFSNMLRAALKGEVAAGRELHYRLLPVVPLLFEEGNPVGVKAALALQNLMEEHVRLPLVAATPTLKARLQEAIRLV